MGELGLDEEQIRILKLIEDLKSSSLSISEQSSQVAKIVTAIQQLADKDEEHRLLTGANDDSTFIILARRRLLEAQKTSLDNFGNRISALNSRKSVSAPSDTTDNYESSSEFVGNNLQRSMQESKSTQITEVLQRMHLMAKEEITKSEMNIEELDMSSKVLTELTNQYSAVDVLLNGSRALVKVLDEADRKDRIMMYLSMGFLATVLVYIIYRRILSGPIKLALWAVLRVLGLAKWGAKFYSNGSAPKITKSVSSEVAASATSFVAASVASSVTASAALVVSSVTTSSTFRSFKETEFIESNYVSHSETLVSSVISEPVEKLEDTHRLPNEISSSTCIAENNVAETVHSALNTLDDAGFHDSNVHTLASTPESADNYPTHAEL